MCRARPNDRPGSAWQMFLTAMHCRDGWDLAWTLCQCLIAAAALYGFAFAMAALGDAPQSPVW